MRRWLVATLGVTALTIPALAVNPSSSKAVTSNCKITKVGTGMTPGTRMKGLYADCTDSNGNLIARIWNPSSACRLGVSVRVVNYVVYCQPPSPRV